jgi:hypothetical protein
MGTPKRAIGDPPQRSRISFTVLNECMLSSRVRTGNSRTLRTLEATGNVEEAGGRRVEGVEEAGEVESRVQRQGIVDIRARLRRSRRG